LSKGMKMKNWLAHVVATGALALGSQAAQAAIICQGCEYGDDVGILERLTIRM